MPRTTPDAYPYADRYGTPTVPARPDDPDASIIRINVDGFIPVVVTSWGSADAPGGVYVNGTLAVVVDNPNDRTPDVRVIDAAAVARIGFADPADVWDAASDAWRRVYAAAITPPDDDPDAFHAAHACAVCDGPHDTADHDHDAASRGDTCPHGRPTGATCDTCADDVHTSTITPPDMCPHVPRCASPDACASRGPGDADTSNPLARAAERAAATVPDDTPGYLCAAHITPAALADLRTWANIVGNAAAGGNPDDGSWVVVCRGYDGTPWECHTVYIVGCDVAAVVNTYDGPPTPGGTPRGVVVIADTVAHDPDARNRIVDAAWGTVDGCAAATGN